MRCRNLGKSSKYLRLNRSAGRQLDPSAKKEKFWLGISLSPVKMAISFSLSRFQARNFRSSELETARRPSGVTATAVTEAVWPSSWRIVWPLSRSQSPGSRRCRIGQPGSLPYPAAACFLRSTRPFGFCRPLTFRNSLCSLQPRTPDSSGSLARF
jgi:hypothetical protein